MLKSLSICVKIILKPTAYSLLFAHLNGHIAPNSC